jgi:broad specificity phosphatase PhoE
VVATPYGRHVTAQPQDPHASGQHAPGHTSNRRPPNELPADQANQPDQADQANQPNQPNQPGQPGQPGVAQPERQAAARPVTVFLVRHGETPMHADNRFVGRADVELTDLGHAQADQLGEWAATARLSAVASSPLRRARETAEPAARKAGLNIIVDERLVELDFGAAEGLTAVEMRERFPVERAAFEEDPYANPLPGGESPAAAVKRGRAALDDLAAGTVGERVLVVAHGTFLRLVLCDLLGIEPRHYRRVFPVTPNATGAVLRRYAPDRWGLLAWNPPLGSGTHQW